MNIKLEYLYRDAGNFKNWGEVVFANLQKLSVEMIESIADRVLIDRLYFVATYVDVPDLRFTEYVEELDHGWHEVHCFSATEDPTNDKRNRSIEEFLKSLPGTLVT